MHIGRIKENDVRRRQNEKPPDSKEECDAQMKKGADHNSPPAPLFQPQAHRQKEFENLHHPVHRIVRPVWQCANECECERTPPSSHEGKKKNASILPIGQPRFLQTYSHVGGGNLHCYQTLREQADLLPCAPRSFEPPHAKGERAIGTAEK